MITRRTVLGLAASAIARSASLPEQSAALVLERAFSGADLSYLLLDARTGRTIAARWLRIDEPAPVGSLVKPFTALAYGETHEFRFPIYACNGDRCWFEHGHGRLNVVHAIAHSCNAYFLELAADVDRDALESIVQKFGLAVPSTMTPAALIGLHGIWQVPPVAIARAYIELANRSTEPVLTGMALSARSGTGRGVGPGAYVKTGTAVCMHDVHANGDGYVMAVYPIAAPRHALLIRQHGVPGAQAAYTCGRMRTILGT